MIAGLILVLLMSGGGVWVWLAGWWPAVVKVLSATWSFTLTTTSLPNWLVGLLGICAVLVAVRLIAMAWTKVFNTAPTVLPAITPVRRDPEDRASLDAWAHVDELELSQVAFLWDGKAPGSQPSISADPEYARFRMLKEAVEKGELEKAKDDGTRTNVRTVVRRSDLKAFAARRNLYPEFLFPDGPEEAQAMSTPVEETITAVEAVELTYKHLSRSWAEDGTLKDRAVDQLVSAAHAGAIEFTGREQGSDQVVRIDRNFWNTATIGRLSSMRADCDGGYATTTNSFVSDPKTYVGLRVDRAQLKRLLNSPLFG